MKHLWALHKVQRPLSQEALAGLVSELDPERRGAVRRAEFLELYEYLRQEFEQELRADPSSAPRGTAAEPPDFELLRCPHCAFEISPLELEQLRVPPEAVQVSPEPLLNSRTAPSAGVQQMPAGTVIQGRVPPSFFETPHGWWSPSGR